MRRLSVLTVLTLAAPALVLTGCGDDPPEPAPVVRNESAPVSPPPPVTGSSRPGDPRVLVRGRQVTWGLAFLPGGDALVTERDTAKVLRVSPGGQVRELGKVPGVSPGGEGGLLGIAVRAGHAYVYFTSGSDNRIARFRHDGGIGALETLVTGIPKGVNHNGGRLAFGPDGMLYAATGEVGREELSQNRESLGGKILRMTPEGRPAPGNPFGTLVWTYGHRNVQGLAWDGDDRMFATEFGQNTWDEINRIEKGRNYGWPVVEGKEGRDGFTDPLLVWRPSEASPSGLAYAGRSLWAAALRGRRLWQVPVRPDGSLGEPVAHFEGRFGRIRSATRSPDGRAVWLTTDNDEDDKVIVVPLR
ncbi:PQQ-dependent sugar dehydrogenase [Spirillospora albida]|uniref:PQQ-dependent sugar dehydrogenase n=1 Tax=Spirillospora albida TaxID=58123 RepID=UPI0004BE669B|nr:PQQ-dependent sugar dehydrogenase [Spirillospora albida]